MSAPDTVEVDRFILNRIDSIPHLEALLLLWRTRAMGDRSGGDIWSVEQLAQRLWISTEQARQILNDLVREDLIGAADPDHYCYRSDPGRDILVQRVESAYAREMIRITRMVHSKASPAIREFARAFRFKKEQD